MSFSTSTCTVGYPEGILLQVRLPRLAHMILPPMSKFVSELVTLVAYEKTGE